MQIINIEACQKKKKKNKEQIQNIQKNRYKSMKKTKNKSIEY